MATTIPEVSAANWTPEGAGPPVAPGVIRCMAIHLSSADPGRAGVRLRCEHGSIDSSAPVIPTTVKRRTKRNGGVEFVGEVDHAAVRDYHNPVLFLREMAGRLREKSGCACWLDVEP